MKTFAEIDIENNGNYANSLFAKDLWVLRSSKNLQEGE